jgi:hypothetical protein
VITLSPAITLLCGKPDARRRHGSKTVAARLILTLT